MGWWPGKLIEETTHGLTLASLHERKPILRTAQVWFGWILASAVGATLVANDIGLLFAGAPQAEGLLVLDAFYLSVITGIFKAVSDYNRKGPSAPRLWTP